MKNILLFYLIIFSFSSVLYAQPTLIGATPRGGNQFGTILSYTVGDTTIDKIYKFKGVEGAKPLQTHFISAGGKLFGMTSEGGAYNYGVIFEYNPITNVYVKKFDFNEVVGATPSGSLMLASNGKMYGMTQLGGVNYHGVIFEYDHISNTYVKKIDLTSANGFHPIGCSLIEAPNGKLYGMATAGGANQRGVIFEYDYTTNIYTKKVDLENLNGSYPEGSLILASNGKMYGLTLEGGSNNLGVIFEYDYLTNVYTKKYDFITSEGKNPKGSLIEASNGKLYGVTSFGSTGNGGVVFEYDYNNNLYAKKKDLSSITGYYPSGSLFQATNGNLYGCTTEGGGSSKGILFEYQINIDSLSIKAHLISISSLLPYGSLFQASNGKLYGTSSEGGVMNNGTIFEYDIFNNLLLKRKDFSRAECSGMTGSLLKVSNGKFYGMTYVGGSEGQGSIFEYDYGSNEVTVKVNLNVSKGRYPYGSLIEASNGILYGMTSSGGFSHGGVIFQYDYINKVDSSI